MKDNDVGRVCSKTFDKALQIVVLYPQKKYFLKDLCVDGKTILKLILRVLVGWVELD
jgi:hypothetical protein